MLRKEKKKQEQWACSGNIRITLMTFKIKKDFFFFLFSLLSFYIIFETLKTEEKPE